MAREVFTIRRRRFWDSKGDIKVEIECPPLTPYQSKLGLAVKAALANRDDLTGAVLVQADLTGADFFEANLVGADLRWANLSGADLTEANLIGSNLYGAKLAGARIHGDKISSLITSAPRSDGFVFQAFELQAGGVKIKAGCRWFTPAEYRAHIKAAYPGTDMAQETRRILAFIEGRARDLGISAPKAKLVRKLMGAA